MTIRLDPTPVRRTNTHQSDGVGGHHHRHRADAASGVRGPFEADVFEGPARTRQPALAQRGAEPADTTLFGQLRSLLVRLLELLGRPGVGAQPGEPTPAGQPTPAAGAPATASTAAGASPLANRNNEPLPKSQYVDAQGRWTGPSPTDYWNFNRLPGAERQNFYKLQLLNAAPENCYGIGGSSQVQPLPPERRIDLNSDTDLETHMFFTPYGTAAKYSPDQVRAMVAAGVPMATEQGLLITKSGQYQCSQGGLRFDFFDQLPLRAQVEMMQSIARVAPTFHQYGFLYEKLHDPATPADIKAIIDPSLARKVYPRPD